MSYKALFNILLLLITIHGYGQEILDPDRPGESKSPELVKGNNLQIEAGFRKEKVDDGQYMYNHPDAVLRYGLFNALELRMKLTSQSDRNKVSKEQKKGLLPVYFGVKAKILPEHNWLPSIGAMAEVGVPSLASGDYFVDGIPFEFRTLFNNNVTNRFSIQYNAGVSWNETNNKKDNKQWMYTIAPMYKLNDHLQLFIEEYAFLRNGTGAEHYADAGLQFFINKDFVIDVNAGVGLSEFSSDYFIEGGLAYRINFSR